MLAFSLALGSDAPRVDGTEIVQKATENLKADWVTDPTYACTERDETRKGNKVTSKTFEVLMIDGSEYRFPVAFDDQPLSAERNQEELVKLKEEIQRRKNESASARESRINEWKKQRDEDGELILDFPDALAFQLTGEEVKEGRPAYVFHGVPKPGVDAKTRAAKVLTGMQGTAWVDKETLHPMHVECSVFKPVPVYGPLASVLPGTEIEIGMTKVNDSTWLIDVVAMKLNVAKLHFFKSASVTRSTYTHYRPNATAIQELLAEANEH